MTSFLKTTGAMPFTAAEIAAELKIDPDRFGPTIDAVISTVCLMATRPVVSSVWALTVGADFYRRSLHGGIAPTSIGEPYEYKAGLLTFTVRDCTYEPDADAVALARTLVLRRLRNSNDRELALAIRDGAVV